MRQSPDRLYELLPYIYRLRDKDQGHPLRALLGIIAEQVNVVEANIAQLYENWFIETAEEWVVPYIGDLVSYQPAFDLGEPGEMTEALERGRGRILIPRADVANTIRYRRRRGTLAVLELLAQDVAGWPARAVEFYQHLALTQPINHQRPERGQTADIRRGETMTQTGGPFDSLAYTVDVRPMNGAARRGLHNIPNVGLYLWRLKPYAVTHVSGGLLDEKSNCFTFSILGNDVQLYLRPQSEAAPTSIAGEWNLPVPIRRLALERWQQDGRLGEIYGPEPGKSFAIWAVRRGASKRGEAQLESVLIQPDQIRVADLSDWKYEPRTPGRNELPQVMIDPERGYIVFPTRAAPDEVLVSYHYGFSDDLGGGSYTRPLVDPTPPLRFTAHDVRDWEALAGHLRSTLTDGLKKRLPDDLERRLPRRNEDVTTLHQTVMLDCLNLLLDARESIYDKTLARMVTIRPETYQRYLEILDGETTDADDIRYANRLFLEDICPDALARCFMHYDVQAQPGDQTPLRDVLQQWAEEAPRTAVIEIGDSSVYEEEINFSVGPYQTLHLRAAQGQQPVIYLGERSRRRLDALVIKGGPASHLTLDGLLIAGRSVQIVGETEAEDDSDAPDERAISEITIRHCTLVPGWEPAPYDEPDCRPRYPEEYSLELYHTGAHVRIERSILGSIKVVQDEVMTDPILIRLSDSILDSTARNLAALDGRADRAAHAVLRVERCTVIGMVKAHAFDLAENTIFDGVVWMLRRQRGCMRFCWYTPREDGRQSRLPRRFNCQPDLAEAALRAELAQQQLSITDDVIAAEIQRVAPRFNSRNYGSAVYCQLAPDCDDAITTGADDESEIGVFHDLYQPQRQANLRARLATFVPAGVDAGLIFAS